MLEVLALSSITTFRSLCILREVYYAVISLITLIFHYINVFWQDYQHTTFVSFSNKCFCTYFIPDIKLFLNYCQLCQLHSCPLHYLFKGLYQKLSKEISIYIFLLPCSFYTSKSYCKSMKRIPNCNLST